MISLPMDAPCPICKEPKPPSELVDLHGCSHKFCYECTTLYVAFNLRQDITRIPCPIPWCNAGSLRPARCRHFLPAELHEQWRMGFGIVRVKYVYRRVGAVYRRWKGNMLMKMLAMKSRWRRCPRCKIYVEKMDGYHDIECRCGHHFCYSCGTSLMNKRYNIWCRVCRREH